MHYSYSCVPASDSAGLLVDGSGRSSWRATETGFLRGLPTFRRGFGGLGSFPTCKTTADLGLDSLVPVVDLPAARKYSCRVFWGPAGRGSSAVAITDAREPRVLHSNLSAAFINLVLQLALLIE